MTWAGASQALRWSDSGTAWHHLAPVSNGLDTSIPLPRHNGLALPSLMASLSACAFLFPHTHTHTTNTTEPGGLKRLVMRRERGERVNGGKRKAGQLMEREDNEGAIKGGEGLRKRGRATESSEKKKKTERGLVDLDGLR